MEMEVPEVPDLTFGQKAVGLAFNPDGDTDVTRIKVKFAEIIDELHEMRIRTGSAEVGRMCSVAITEAQSAQMWAVKAATWKE